MILNSLIKKYYYNCTIHTMIYATTIYVPTARSVDCEIMCMYIYIFYYVCCGNSNTNIIFKVINVYEVLMYVIKIITLIT